MDLNLDLVSVPAPEAVEVSLNDGDDWVDPMIGIRSEQTLSKKWTLEGWAMIGAGVADLDWDFYAAANYKLGKSAFLLAGYRAAGVDYSKGAFVFDNTLAGSILGIQIDF